MKFTPRPTASIVRALRITAPETREDAKSGKRIVLLSYIDAGSYQQHHPTTKDLFVYAGGTNQPGEPVTGLDRLMHHHFNVHKSSSGKVIGLDIIPNRLYRSGVTPVSQKDVKTLVIQYELNGAVAKVTQRPFNTRFEQSAAVIRELDRLITDGKNITPNMKLGSVGRVVNVTQDSVEVKLTEAGRAPAPVSDRIDEDALAEEE